MPRVADPSPPPEILPARTAGLEVAEVDGELVVLHPGDRRAHHLDVGLALVFDACDGTTTLADLAGEVAEASGGSAGEAADWIGRAIQILREHHLVDGAADPSP